MSDEALKYKKSNPNLNYKKMSIQELHKLPVHNGIINFKITKTAFLMLNILNDDSSITKYFWQDSHDLQSLDLWYELSLEKGVFIDVGAHTGLFSMTSVKANEENVVICFEPYFMNMARLITNLRLNGITKNVKTILAAVSNFNGKTKFSVSTEKSYLSKWGKIDTEGKEIDAHTLDSLFFNKLNKPLKAIKIDTEGEDHKVLMGAEKLINKYKPKLIIEVSNENKINIKNFLKKINYKNFMVSNIKEKVDLEIVKMNNSFNIFATYE